MTLGLALVSLLSADLVAQEPVQTAPKTEQHACCKKKDDQAGRKKARRGKKSQECAERTQECPRQAQTATPQAEGKTCNKPKQTQAEQR